MILLKLVASCSTKKMSTHQKNHFHYTCTLMRVFMNTTSKHTAQSINISRSIYLNLNFENIQLDWKIAVASSSKPSILQLIHARAQHSSGLDRCSASIQTDSTCSSTSSWKTTHKTHSIHSLVLTALVLTMIIPPLPGKGGGFSVNLAAERALNSRLRMAQDFTSEFCICMYICM